MLFDVKITKLDVVESFDTSTLPEASVRYVTQYGFNKSINDAHASIKRSDYETESEWQDAVREAAYARVEQIRSGNVPGTRAPADPAKKRAAALDLLKTYTKEELQEFMRDARAARDAA